MSSSSEPVAPRPADPASPHKEEILHSFVRELANKVPEEHVLGLDTGLTENDATISNDELGTRGAAGARQDGRTAGRPASRSHVCAGAAVYGVMNTKEPFETVVSRHGPVVLRVCRAVLSTHADAEDAWSETFLAALRAYPELPATANVQAWLVTIAHRKAVDVVRTRSRAAVPVASLPEPPAHWDDRPEHDSPLWTAVAALPPKQRHAVAYRYLGGLPYRQIAELLGGTPAAARRAAADGVATLRRALADTRAENHAENHAEFDRTGEDR